MGPAGTLRPTARGQGRAERKTQGHPRVWWWWGWGGMEVEGGYEVVGNERRDTDECGGGGDGGVEVEGGYEGDK